MAANEEAIFRSADMILVQIYIASEIARDCVSVLGELGNIQFLDLNESVNSFQRSFVKETRKFDNTERQLRYLQSVIEQQDVEIKTTSYDDLIRKPTRNLEDLVQRPSPTTSEMDALVQTVDEYERNVRDMVNTYHGLEVRQQGFLEQRTVLQGTRTFFDSRLSFELDGGNSLAGGRSWRNGGISGRSSEESLLTEEEEVPVMLDVSDSEEFDMGDIEMNRSSNNGDSSMHNRGPRNNEVSILGSTMSVISGTIDTDKYMLLERILWRSLRGNLYMNQVPIEEPVRDPETGKQHIRCIFVIFTHGPNLISRCKKIAESLDGRLVDVPADYDEYTHNLRIVNRKLADLDEVLEHTLERLVLELKEVALEIERWKMDITKEKAVYSTMNLFDYDPDRRCLIAEGWMPESDLGTVKAAMRDVTERCGTDINSVVSVVHTNRTPPTFFRTNKFTESFQAIVDAYGIASYREINPGLPSIVTFPFMFAIMFGDMGHGFLMFLAAAVLCLKESSIAKMKHRDEIFDMAYTGRYVLLLMGLFSMYTGFMYNDLFSRPVTLFASRWKYPSGFEEGASITAKQTGVYPLGLDWAWHAAENTLLFANSYKMKLSILMGFIHMSYSLQFSLVNYRFFKSKVDIIGNYIPGFLFMHCIFGYLCITIVYKWCVDWIGDGKVAPSLLNMLINMFLSPGTVDEQLYPGQSFVQITLLAVALVCVPWLLLYKPLTLRYRHNHPVKLGYTEIQAESRDSILPTSGGNPVALPTSAPSDETQSFTLDSLDGEQTTAATPAPSEETHVDDFETKRDEFNFGDIMVNQVIYTIEFCLNCVSHTASYLRLWALSLAHNQLSSVLWNMTLKNSFVSYKERGFWGCIIVFFLFAMWFVLTVAVLVCMEGTSAMLHSLRLHWVEAMSKHFEGEGYKYTPFSFYELLTNGGDQE